MLFRILTEDLNREKIAVLLDSQGFEAFTLIPSRGYWKGKAENSLTVEIDAPDCPRVKAKVRSVALGIKLLNGQEAVLVQEVPVSRSELV